MKISKYTFLIISFLSLFWQSEAQSQAKPAWVTVYVHGTITTVGLMLISKLYPDLGYGKPGLHHISQLTDTALFRKDVADLTFGASDRFDPDHFYTFGWSGKLSFNERYKAGKALFEELKKLLSKYKKEYGYYPKLRLLTFSHGGNVALNMVESLPFFEGQHVHLELLIVACPVQKVTEHLIDHAEIDKVYTIASTSDLLQIADVYKHGNKLLMPKRFFSSERSHCCQVCVKINGRGIGHIELLRSIMVHIPYILNNADTSFKTENCCNFDYGFNPGAKVLHCNIHDAKFKFYNGINFFPVLLGKRYL